MQLAAALIVTLACCGAAHAQSSRQLDAKVYDSAARFLAERRDISVLNGSVAPHWRDGSQEGFTYLKALGEGRSRFVFVEAATGRASAAFDPAIIAAGLSHASGKAVEAEALGFTDYERVGTAFIRFTLKDKSYTCSTVRSDCREAKPDHTDTDAVISPDGKWAAFVKDYNLWIRPAGGGEAFALTTDGQAHYAYAATPEGTSAVVPPVLSGKPLEPVVLWSPDSRRLLTSKLDERKVLDIGLFRSTPTDGTVRPTVVSWRFAMPGDAAVPMEQTWVFDIVARTGRPVDLEPYPALFMTSVGMKEAWWSADARSVYLINRPRYYKSMTLNVIDAASGNVSRLITETGKTFVEAAGIGYRPLAQVLHSGEVIWFSERDGWGHLYLYDAAGKLQRRLTQGAWSVRNIVRVDGPAGEIYLLASGRERGSDPYFSKLYRLRVSDGLMRLLTPEEAAHEIASPLIGVRSPPSAPGETPDAKWSFSPSGRYFLDTYSTARQAPRTVLRRADGTLIAEVEHADLTGLQADGFVLPERFTALAADGQTILYGNIQRPSDFDPSKRYPVLDSIYPGPQSRRVRDDFMNAVFDGYDSQALAALGFIVITVDGRGTPGRSKTFLDLSYGDLGQASNLEDHVAVIKTLGARYSWMDLERVGIYGFSAGGYASAHAILAHPDFFKVAFSGAGNHNQSLGYSIWGETYNGPDDETGFSNSNNVLLAKNLKGKLMLVQGEADYNVNPAQTMQLADALIKANKDFDMLILPNVPHAMTPYIHRRLWDYLVRNLQGAEPPANYTYPSPVENGH